MNPDRAQRGGEHGRGDELMTAARPAPSASGPASKQGRDSCPRLATAIRAM